MNKKSFELQELAENWASLQARLTAAEQRGYRAAHPSPYQVLAVTKYHGVERLEALLQATNLCHFAESRLQELKPKIQYFHQRHPQVDIHWHFIGSLQSRKVREVVQLVDSIHSIDSLPLLWKVEKERANFLEHGRRAGELVDQKQTDEELIRPKTLQEPLKLFLQLNLSGESSKHGFHKEDLLQWMREAAAERASLKACQLVGLMTMAPKGASEEELRRLFRELRNLLEDCQRLLKAQGEEAVVLTFDQLSMGMSQDFEVALEEGSTCLRLGRCLLGEPETRAEHGSENAGQ